MKEIRTSKRTPVPGVRTPLQRAEGTAHLPPAQRPGQASCCPAEDGWVWREHCVLPGPQRTHHHQRQEQEKGWNPQTVTRGGLT